MLNIKELIANKLKTIPESKAKTDVVNRLNSINEKDGMLKFKIKVKAKIPIDGDDIKGKSDKDEDKKNEAKEKVCPKCKGAADHGKSKCPRCKGEGVVTENFIGGSEGFAPVNEDENIGDHLNIVSQKLYKKSYTDCSDTEKEAVKLKSKAGSFPNMKEAATKYIG